MHAFDLSGRKLFSRALPRDAGCRVAVDTDSGNLWVLAIADHTDVLVLDQHGAFLNSYPTDAFNLCYSGIDKAMWLVGRKDVRKLDVQTGISISSFKLPGGIFACVHAIPDPQGGVVCVEAIHPDMAKSRNRIWRFDTHAKLIASVDLGATRLNNIACVKDEIWMTGTKASGFHAPQVVIERVAMRLDQNLAPIDGANLEFDSFRAVADGKSAWVFDDGPPRHVTIDEQRQIQVSAEPSTDQ